MRWPPRWLFGAAVLVPLVVTDAGAGTSAIPSDPPASVEVKARPTSTTPPPRADVVRLRALPGGTALVRGRGPVEGRHGPIVRYTVEVDRGLRHPVARATELDAVVRRAFADQERGWTARGVWRLQRVGRVRDASVRIVLARPARVDAYCRLAGLNTAGRYSCWNGRVAALNLDRWRWGAAGFTSIRQYRTYQVNHEVGHGLGQGHRYCLRRGARAPVMQQQTKSMQGCRANGWPYH